jgi:hypothetical protein
LSALIPAFSPGRRRNILRVSSKICGWNGAWDLEKSENVPGEVLSFGERKQVREVVNQSGSLLPAL